MSQLNLQHLLARPIGAMLASIRQEGGTPYLVGGWVRDTLMGLTPKDLDVEVYGLSAGRLRQVLEQHGRVFAVGVSFGVLKVYLSGGLELDVALPRRDSYKGERGFLAEVTADITLPEAAARRDFTINAMAVDPASGKLLDFYGGQADLQAGILRHTGPAFVEDPLRVLRAMQFAARWEFRLAPETVAICASLRPEYPRLPKDRVWGEWHKLLEKSKRPSSGLEVLEQTGWRSLYPSLETLAGDSQGSETIWTATLRATDTAKAICDRDKLEGSDRLVLLLAAICHALGGPAIRTGVAEEFLLSIGCPRHLSVPVLPLVKECATYLEAGDGDPTARQVRRLSYRLNPATIEQWERLVEAVNSPARSGWPWLVLGQELGCADHPLAPLLLGRHLQEAGLKPGPRYRQLLDAAFEAQLDGVFTTLEEAKAWLSHQPETDDKPLN